MESVKDLKNDTQKRERKEAGAQGSGSARKRECKGVGVQGETVVQKNANFL